MSLILGLTGGIATGKTTAVKVFKRNGFPVVDSDQIARQVVEPETPGLKAVTAVFGEEILNEDGTLNRKKLGRLIFSNDKKRALLDDTLAPFLQEQISQAIKAAAETSQLVIADIPLLYEKNYEDSVDRIAVVYIPEQLQVTRLAARDAISEVEACQRMNSQLPIEEKKKRADIVFDNQGTVEKLERQILNWLKDERLI
ncbi:dephospho-CoA kinase [Enterococcus sp. LJL128]|uniref:dephospho-CoA kinase n=1 Tax=Enterococcus sp. LJL51 TaxID=3416656 RepID=UPI003CF4F8C7